MKPYALKSGEGRTYRFGIDFTVKAGELLPGRGAAFTEYTTRKGEEPPDHTHPTEDEVFYVLSGDLEFHCGGESFEVSSGGFIYLPQGIEHGYTILSDGDVRLIAVTFPTQITEGEGWGGFIADLEIEGELISDPCPKRCKSSAF
ncbi:MAG: cupin domain-containing protein [Armatimonadetes bacterium]|nr:cupin domain-containing protein [Armatimonadota bacterium]